MKKKKILEKAKSVKAQKPKRTEQLRPTRTDYIQKKYLTNKENELTQKTGSLKLDYYMYAKPTKDFKTNVRMMIDEVKIYGESTPNGFTIFNKYLNIDYLDKLDDKIKKLGEKLINPYDIMDDNLKYILNEMLKSSEKDTQISTIMKFNNFLAQYINHKSKNKVNEIEYSDNRRSTKKPLMPLQSATGS